MLSVDHDTTDLDDVIRSAPGVTASLQTPTGMLDPRFTDPDELEAFGRAFIHAAGHLRAAIAEQGGRR